MRHAIGGVVLALALVLAACGGRSPLDDPDPESPTILEVDNRASQDMTIYVIREGGQRQRLGTATSHSRTELRIPDRILFGVTSLRFQADPIGSNRNPVSESVTVVPGDTVVMEIPPR